MGFFKRLFGLEKPANAEVNPTPTETHPETGGEIPPERLGVNGEYDQSGLAKRVALAFEDDSDLKDLERLWIAQTGSTVVLKGDITSSELLDKAVQIASGVSGAESVDSSEVNVA